MLAWLADESVLEIQAVASAFDDHFTLPRTLPTLT